MAIKVKKLLASILAAILPTSFLASSPTTVLAEGAEAPALRYEAEDADSFGGWAGWTDMAGASGGKVVIGLSYAEDHANSMTFSESLAIPAAGLYIISLTYTTGAGGTEILDVNGTEYTVAFPTTSDWTTYIAGTVSVVIPLKGDGSDSITFYDGGSAGAMWLDYFELTPYADPYRYEAEDADSFGGRAGWTDMAGASGGKVVIGLSYTEDHANFMTFSDSLRLPHPGRYRLDITYTSGSSGAVTVNANGAEHSLPFATTSDWTVYAAGTVSMFLELKGDGTDTLTFYDGSAAGAMWIDYFRLEPVGDPLASGMDIYGDLSIAVVGDSISHGANAFDIPSQSYVGLLRQAVNAAHGSGNDGFITLQSSIGNVYGVYREKHTVNYTGAWDRVESGDYLGFFALSSTDPSGMIIADMPEASPFIRIFYEEAPGNGIFEVAVNGQTKLTVDSAAQSRTPAARTALIETGGEAPLRIEIRKKDGKPTAISGIGYYRDPDTVTVNNYSRSGARVVDVEPTVLEAACTANVLVFSLGFNDYMQEVDHTAFSQQIDRVIAIVQERGSRLIVNDFIWQLPVTDSFYKQQLQRLAVACGGIYNDYHGTYLEHQTPENSFIQDGAHPTVSGHRIVAEQLCGALGQITGRTYTLPETAGPKTRYEGEFPDEWKGWAGVRTLSGASGGNVLIGLSYDETHANRVVFGPSLDIPQSGLYRLTVNYMTGDTGALLTASVNGQEVTLPCPSTTSQWAEYKGDRVSALIRLKGDGSDAIAFWDGAAEGSVWLDCFTLEPAEAQAIASYEPPADISAEIASPFDSLPLPETLPTKLEDGTMLDLMVEWEKEGFDSGSPGLLTLTGQFILPEGIANPRDIQPVIQVNILEGPEEEVPQTGDPSPLAAMLLGLAAGGICWSYQRKRS